jgi:hypothetical protein
MEWMNDDTYIYPGPLLIGKQRHSWIDSRTGGYRIGAVNLLPMPRPSMPVMVAQDWHSREVLVLSQDEVATLRPYPAEPIPEPEART